MKFLGWVFTVFLIAALGYAACYFGWVEELIEAIKTLE